MLKICTASVVGLDKIEKRPDGLYEQSTPGTLCGELLLDGVRYSYRWTAYAGFVWDGASNLKWKWLQKLFPCYVEGDPVYNKASELHDWLYATGGQLAEGVNITRDECDDAFRGVARESDFMQSKRSWIARTLCSAADFFIYIFAGGDRHWCNDSYCIKGMAYMQLEKL